MEFSTDYAAVFESHRALEFFDRYREVTFSERAAGFSPANAWWLAELSRWMYQGKRSPDRVVQQRLLARVGLRETGFFSVAGTHCSLVQSEDRRFAVLIFRGTSQTRNWWTNAYVGPLRNNAHRGYEIALDKVWPQVLHALAGVDCPLYMTGHSMGGALATLAARRVEPHALYTFGSPPVGNQALVASMAHIQAFRVVNFRDLATRVPCIFSFSHVGTLHYLSWDHSLWSTPDLASIVSDRRRGPRSITGKLNRGKLIRLQEALSDHAPLNYVAHLERLSAGSGDAAAPASQQEVRRPPSMQPGLARVS